MREKLELWEVGIPTEDLMRLNERAKIMSEESGVKTNASDIFRHIVSIVVEAPEKYGIMLTEMIKENVNGDTSKS